MHAADIGPVDPREQTQSAFDLFLIFVGANVVATTFQVGASLAPAFPVRTTLALIAIGSVAGAALVAALAPLGPRLRVPSVVAARAALGIRGAGLVAAVLYITNFAWIALNNVIAASACARVLGGPESQAAWSVAMGLLATAVVAGGPRMVARADRVAVPLMMAVAAALTIAVVRVWRAPAAPPPAGGGLSWLGGLDVVIGYQVSWILMFADYSRYTRSARRSGAVVFAALAATSLWMMPLGALAARAAGTADPGAMLAAVGLGGAGAVLLAIATLTTNFVNIYMSSLAWKSLWPDTRDAYVIWPIGLIGTALGAVPGVWLDQYTTFMTWLGAILVPASGVLLAHFYGPAGRAARRNPERTIAELYDRRGPFAGFSRAGLLAWAAGAAAYFAAGRWGGTLPALVVAVLTYTLIRASASGGHEDARRQSR
jgi:purine-cytosine permease-like protein